MKRLFILFTPFLIIFSLTLIYYFKKTDKNTNFLPQRELYEPVLTNYLPIKEGTFWVYEGTVREQKEGGDFRVSILKKRVTVSKIEKVDNFSVIYMEGGDYPLFIAKNNTIDFQPDENHKDKFYLTFPLEEGIKWGSGVGHRDDGYYSWEIEKKIPRNVLGKDYEDCYRIAYKTLPDTSYKVFCYGLGIVEEGYIHNGTILEEKYNLVDTNIIN